MKLTKKIIIYLLASGMLFTITACGGGGSSSDMISVKDSDGDGFYDAIDPAPNDASNPGDFSRPEKILDNPKIKEVLKIAKRHGVDMDPQLGKNPPNLTGYYRQDERNGVVIATENGQSVGNNYVGQEARVSTNSEYYESMGVIFSHFRPIGWEITKGSFLRGSENHFTRYTPTKYACTEDGANYATYRMEIISASVDSSSGNIVDRKRVYIKVGSTGKLTSACDSRIVGGAKNKWGVSTHGTLHKINDVTDLEYMCVDDNKAYIPNETWKNSDKESCKCTTDYEVECE